MASLACFLSPSCPLFINLTHATHSISPWKGTDGFKSVTLLLDRLPRDSAIVNTTLRTYVRPSTCTRIYVYVLNE